MRVRRRLSRGRIRRQFSRESCGCHWRASYGRSSSIGGRSSSIGGHSSVGTCCRWPVHARGPS